MPRAKEVRHRQFLHSHKRWSSRWAEEQRALGRRPTWREFIAAAQASGHRAVCLPGFKNYLVPVHFLEWALVDEPGVYFLASGERVKIGYTAKFIQRFSALQAMTPDRLSVVAAFYPANLKHERALHAAFDRFRLNGEWFEFSEPMRRFVGWAKNRYTEIGPPTPARLRTIAAQFVNDPAEGSCNVVSFCARD